MGGGKGGVTGSITKVPLTIFILIVNCLYQILCRFEYLNLYYLITIYPAISFLAPDLNDSIQQSGSSSGSFDFDNCSNDANGKPFFYFFKVRVFLIHFFQETLFRTHSIEGTTIVNFVVLTRTKNYKVGLKWKAKIGACKSP